MAHATRYFACILLGALCAAAAVHPPVGARLAAVAEAVGPVAPLRGGVRADAPRPPRRCAYA